MGKILEAREVYLRYKEELKEELKKLPTLTLASLVGEKDYACELYLSSQEKLAKELGINYLRLELKGVSLEEVIEKIKKLNEDKNITGILLNKPFPSHWKEEILFSSLEVKKDIEGVHPYNLGRVILGQPTFVAPTVLSILEFLKMTGVYLEGKEVTIVGFSTIIGKPLSIILANQFATVNITHIATYQQGHLPFYVKRADILISCVGKTHLIKGDWIKENAIVIDVGMAEMNGKVCGDVEFEKAKEKVSFITPTKGGVGLLTTLFIFKNLIKAYNYEI
jgi:methylenetetrahydrofolate dehydrogenase (NADP+)/methenyltetrahydrofolate cyclohydrolase